MGLLYLYLALRLGGATEKTRVFKLLYVTSDWLNKFAEYSGDTATARYVLVLRRKANNCSNVKSGML